MNGYLIMWIALGAICIASIIGVFAHLTTWEVVEETTNEVEREDA